jgi:hypothetical protein
MSTGATTLSSNFDTFVLQQIRCAAARAGLIRNTIVSAGTALKGGLIDGEAALAILAEMPGALSLVGPSSVWGAL